jgi:hypothetical protein
VAVIPACARSTANSGQIRELTAHELDLIAGGLDIGPLHVEAGKGMVAIDVGGYGIWAGQGCVGVYAPDSVKGVCVR